MPLNKNILSLFCLLFFGALQAQNSTDSTSVALNDSTYYYIVDGIDIEGNKKTKARIILREMDFAVGDTLSAISLNERLKTNRNQIYNLGLFNEVEVKIKQFLTHNRLVIAVDLTERFYWLAFPVFELADRNLNVWWRDFNHDFRRTKYGFIINKGNVRGANENIIVNFKWGYNRKLILSYKFPFIDKKKVWGLGINTYYFADRELAIGSVENEAQFLTLNRFSNSRIGVGLEFTHRKLIRNTHKISTYYYHNTIEQEVAEANPDFFLDGQLKQQYLRLRYLFEHDARDIRVYPTEGLYFRGIVRQNGLGVFKDINRTELEADLSKYWKVGKSQFLASNVKLYTSFGKQPPYFNNLRLGFLEHFVRGYEYYVVDAQHYAFFRTAFKERIFDIKWRPYQNRKPKWKMLEQLNMIPIQVYLKAYNELAYSIDKYYGANNPLSNELLAGFGVGIDIVTFYDNLYSFDYTFNRQGGHGFFVHVNVTWDFY